MEFCLTIQGGAIRWDGELYSMVTESKGYPSSTGLGVSVKGNDSKPKKMTKEDWENLESECISTIRLCIADNIINNVIDEDSAPTLWEKLEKLYLGKSLTTKLNLKRDLYS